MKQLSMFDDEKEELHKAEKGDKPIIRFKKDCKDLNKSFLKGSEWEIYKEDKSHYTILYEGVYYSPYKQNCEVVK